MLSVLYTVACGSNSKSFLRFGVCHKVRSARHSIDILYVYTFSYPGCEKKKQSTPDGVVVVFQGRCNLRLSIETGHFTPEQLKAGICSFSHD